MAALDIYAYFRMLPGREAVELAPLVEEAGFDGGSVADHLFVPHSKPGAYPYSADGKPSFPLDIPFPDAFVTLSALAAVTTRMRFLTAVYILPLRNPLIVARAVGTAAVLSDNRVGIGIGVGWMRDEFDVLGEDFTTRGARTDEMVDVLRVLWRDAPAEHNGRFYSFGPLYMEPRPTRRPPIFVGGTSEAALRRAARIGDGFVAPPLPVGEDEALIHRLHELLEMEGRDRSSFRILVPCPRPRSPEEVIRLAELGADIVKLMPWPDPATQPSTLDEKRRELERVATEIVEPTRRALASA